MRSVSCLLFLLVLFATPASSEFLQAGTRYGSYNVLLVSNSALGGGRVLHVKTVGNTLYFVQTVDDRALAPPLVAQVNRVVGRPVTSFAWLVGPIGCDNTDFAKAIVATNCAKDNVEALEHAARIRNTWFLPHRGERSDACFLAGGDAKSCFGPPLVLGSEFDGTEGAPAVFTDLELLWSDGVVVEAGSGYLGAVPSLAQIDMVMPKLLVTAPACVALPISSNLSFSGPYAAYPYDAVSGTAIVVWRVFKRDDGVLPQMRVLFRRTAPDSDDFQIVLGDALGGILSDAFFRAYFVSPVYRGTGTRNWPSLVPMETPINMTSVAGNLTTNPSCTLVLGVQAAPFPPQLKQLFPTTSTNFLNKPPYPVFYTTFSCFFAVCGLDVNNDLVFPNCPDGTLRGGYAEFVTRSPDLVVEFPTFVPPNVAYRDYEEDKCAVMYPLAPTFTGFGLGGGNGPTYERFVPAQERCYFPMFSVDLILSNTFVEERQRQCTMMGGFSAGFTKDVCYAPLTYVRCKTGYTFFGGYCYYVFSAVTDAKYQTNLAGAQAQCESIPGAPFGIEALVTADFDLRVWLQNYFVLVRRTVPGYPYRFPVADTGESDGGCFCLDFLPGLTSDIDVGTTSLCICGDPAFPVCRYPEKSHEVVDRYVSQSIRTIRVLRDGQVGAPPTGQPAVCRCFPGWFGTDCRLAGCPIEASFPTHLIQTTNDPRTNFYLRCTANDNGKCRGGQPVSCFCDSRHGPAASLLPGSPFFQFADTPCACPSGSAPDQASGSFQINNVVYPSGTLGLNAVCGTLKRGRCRVDNTTNFGVCECRGYFDPYLNSSVAINGGDACTCPIPKVPAFGYALEMPQVLGAACNRRGTCCPSVVGLDNSQACYSRLGVPEDGCACDNGWVGEACTCPVPLDIAKGYAVQTAPNSARVFVDLAYPRFLTRVVIGVGARGLLSGNAPTSGCVPLWVGIAASALQTAAVLNCSLRSDDGSPEYACPTTGTGRRFVIVMTSAASPAPNCLVQAYTSDVPACGWGNHTNPFAGRFFASAVYDAPALVIDEQPTSQAARGCTLFGCMCNPDYTGPGCGVGISAVTQDPDGLFSAKVVGETTQPKRGAYDSTTQTGKCLSVTTAGAVSFGGLPRGVYTEDACECSEFFVQDRGRRYACSGHGRCKRASFPWGSCSFDVDAFELDPLWRPLVSVPDDCNDPFVRFIQRGKWLANVVPVERNATANATTTTTFSPTRSPTSALTNDSVLCLGPDNPIGPYSNTLGFAYGLWWNQLWGGATFYDWPGAAALGGKRFFLVSSLLNHQRWFSRDSPSPPYGNTSLQLLNIPILDAYNTRLARNYTAAQLRSALGGTNGTGAWPYNLELAEAYADAQVLDSSIFSRAISATNPEDVAFVAAVWSAVLAPRRCTNDVQCVSFSPYTPDPARDIPNPTCVYDAVDYVPWRQGDPAWSGQLAVGDEGGCACGESNAQGFWAQQLFCTACVDGYGPANQPQWISVAAQQARLLAVVGPGVPLLFDPTTAPFNAIVAASGQTQIDLLNATLFCRVPYSFRTDGHFCGGFGLAAREIVSPDVSAQLVLFRVPRAKPFVSTPRCLSVIVDGSTQMQGTFLGENLLRYASGDGARGISVVGGTSYFWGFSPVGGEILPGLPSPSCSLRDPPFGTKCTYEIVRTDLAQLVEAVRTVEVACVHPAFFNSPYHVDAWFTGGGGSPTDPIVARASGPWSFVLEFFS